MDWKKNRLPLAGIAFLALVVVAVIASRSEYDVADVGASDLPTLPTIDTETLTDVLITRPGEGASLHLSKSEAGWRVVEPVEAVADESAISALMARLAELEVRRVAATRAENHERLEVDDANGIRLIVSAGDDEIVDLLVGTSREQTTMVRVPGEDTVLGVQGALRYSVDRDVTDWREKTVLALDPATLQTLNFQSETGTFRFVRDPDGAWAQAEGEEPIETFDPARVDAAARTVVQLRASDFALPGATPQELGLSSPHATVTFTTRAPTGPGEAPVPVPDVTHTLRVGSVRGERERFVEVEGDEERYVVTTFTTDKFSPDSAAFVAPPPGSQPPGGMPGMPPGMGMPGGQGQIPPEILQQLQQQLGQAGR